MSSCLHVLSSLLKLVCFGHYVCFRIIKLSDIFRSICDNYLLLMVKYGYAYGVIKCVMIKPN